MANLAGAFGILISAAVGTLFLVPAHGLAQADVFSSGPVRLLGGRIHVTVGGPD